MTTTYNPTAKITKFQIKRIMANCQYNVDIKNEWVQWATDSNQTSLRTITQAQAVQIIKAQEGSVSVNQTASWAKFDKSNPKHKLILSLLRQANWTKPHPRHGEVADMDRLDAFLKSVKSPVNKPLKDMSSEETEKVIKALSGIVKSRYK
ncbi:MAG: hypothetical protein AB7D46_00700 [Flavobacteriaceae bacterium]